MIEVESVWSRIAAKKFYIIFVIAPTFLWLWGAVLAMFVCSVHGPPFGRVCTAAFWAAGAATPFHVFSAHLFICLVYPKNILIDRHEVAGSKRLTYGFVFLAPFIAILGVIWMYLASGSSEILIRIPLFIGAMVYLATVGYVPLVMMLRAKRKSDQMKAVNFMKRRTASGTVSIVNKRELGSSSLRSYRMLTVDWWKHPFLYMYTEGGVVADYVADLVTRTWVYDSQVGRDAFNMKHSGVVVQELHWICNHQLIRIYERKRDDDTSALRQLQQTATHEAEVTADEAASQAFECAKTRLAQSARMRQSIMTLKVTNQKVRASRRDSMLSPTRQGPLPLRDDEVYLFHGTKKRFARQIIEEGLDTRKSRDGLYGRGIYLTESSQKADQYSDTPNKRRRKDLTMFVVRTRLGSVKEWNKPGPYIDEEDEGVEGKTGEGRRGGRGRPRFFLSWVRPGLRKPTASS